MANAPFVLNSQQRKAVRYRGGPLLIIAGAGTGKTTVITERIKHLILTEQAKPSEILALTFTEKAAREMEERVDAVMPYGYTQMWISTFHAFCDRVLRQDALHIGLDHRYKLLTQAETIQFIRKHLFSFKLDYFRPLGNPTKFIGALLQHFSRLQDEDVTPEAYLRYAKRISERKSGDKEKKAEAKKTIELAEAFRTYDLIKTKEAALDFGDLIGRTLELFRRRPNVLREYHQQFKHVLVDEFQDTNIAQNELVKILVGKYGNITVVADDDQSIYKWRGAAVSNVIQFRESYPKARLVTLTQNYRSVQEILDRAYDLIQHNNPDRLEAVEKIDKKLIAQRTEAGGVVTFLHSDRVENEAEEVAKKVKRLVDSEGFAYKDIAILVRANNHAEPFIRAFGRHGIPYQFLGPGRLFRQPEVIDLVAYLKMLYNFENSLALYRVLSIAELNIPAKDLVRLTNYARRFNLSLYDACEKLPDSGIPHPTREKIDKIKKIIEKHLKRVNRETAGQLLYDFLQEAGLLEKLLNPKSEFVEKKAANISKLFDKLKTYEIDHDDASVPAVVDWMEISSELGESPLATDIDWTQVNAINILTIHSAKGLEFPVVFLVNLVSQRFPTLHRREQIPIPERLIKELLPKGDYHEQEERRLFYVGMTRARDRLFFTAANYYGEGKREKKLSPFIFEALGDDTVAVEQREQDRQLTFLDYAPTTYPSAVSHQSSAHHIDYLSYSQMETFGICPLHYKLKYILKIPTPPSAAQGFGTSVHAALKEVYRSAQRGEKVTANKAIGLLRQNWISEGYSSKSHERKMLSHGERYLSVFVKEEYSSKKLPAMLEQSFVVPLAPKSGDQRPLKIGGRIDRVDMLQGGKIEIIDYKTGANVPTQKRIDHDLQLTMYALAAQSIREQPFNKNPQDVTLSLYYFDSQKWIKTQRSSEQLEQAREEIFEWREKIEASDFSCSRHAFCENCEYHLFCRER